MQTGVRARAHTTSLRSNTLVTDTPVTDTNTETETFEVYLFSVTFPRKLHIDPLLIYNSPLPSVHWWSVMHI